MLVSFNKEKHCIEAKREKGEKKINKASTFYFRLGEKLNKILGHNLIRSGLAGVEFKDYNFQYCLYERRYHYRIIWEKANFNLKEERIYQKDNIPKKNECDDFNDWKPVYLLLKKGI